MTGVQTCALPICFPVTIDTIMSKKLVKSINDYIKIEEKDLKEAKVEEEKKDEKVPSVSVAAARTMANSLQGGKVCKAILTYLVDQTCTNAAVTNYAYKPILRDCTDWSSWLALYDEVRIDKITLEIMTKDLTESYAFPWAVCFDPNDNGTATYANVCVYEKSKIIQPDSAHNHFTLTVVKPKAHSTSTEAFAIPEWQPCKAVDDQAIYWGEFYFCSQGTTANTEHFYLRYRYDVSFRNIR